MDTVYGTKKYFQSLAATDTEYTNNRNANKMMRVACSSYQNTVGRQSTGPYSHLSAQYPYQMNGNDYSHTSQYGYNSWGMWRDSRNLTPSSSFTTKDRSSFKSFTIILITAAFIVVVAVLSVAALAFYFSTFKSDDSIMVFDGRFQVTRGDVFTTGLRYNHTTAYQSKVDFYRNMITESLENNGLFVHECQINGFGTGPLINVEFRVFLDMQRVPINVRSVEDHIKDSLLKEVMSLKSARGLQIDLSTLEIKRQLDANVVNSASVVREKATKFTTEKLEEPIRKSSTSFGRTNQKFHTKPTPAVVSEPTAIDAEDTPEIIEGSFEVTKTDGDLTQKKLKVSTLRPFTITNSAVRMKTKKTTIEKVKPLPKVPENLTANILKVDNVTKSYQEEPQPTMKSTKFEESVFTTPRTVIRQTTSERNRIPSTTASTTTTTTTVTTTTTEAATTAVTKLPEMSMTVQPTTVKIESTSFTSDWYNINTNTFSPAIKKMDINFGELLHEDTIVPTTSRSSEFSKNPFIDDQPWRPIQPSIEPIFNPNSLRRPPPSHELNILSRNSVRRPISALPKNKLPPIYHSYTNPSLTLGIHDIEHLGSGPVKPYPIPIDLIGEQILRKNSSDLVLNKGEVLVNEYPFKGSSPIMIASEAEITPPTISEETKSKEKDSSAEETMAAENLTEAVKTVSTEVKETMDMTAENQTVLGSSETTTSNRTNVAPDSEEKLESKIIDDGSELSLDDIFSTTEIDKQTAAEGQAEDEDDQTEQMQEIATAISSMGILSFNNIKDYIMATTKSWIKEPMASTESSTESKKLMGNDSTETEEEKIKDEFPVQLSSSTATLPSTTSTTTTAKPMEEEQEPSTVSYIEVETVKYTPGMSTEQHFAAPASAESSWELFNSSNRRQHQKPRPVKIFNETLQAWIVQNPTESEQHIKPIHHFPDEHRIIEPMKNISAIFDLLASRLNLDQSLENKRHSTPTSSEFLPTHFPESRVPPTVQTLRAQTTEETHSSEEMLPVLLPLSTEDSLPSTSGEKILGQAEVEVVDPTQYEQMLLIDRVSTTLSRSTPPPLITLMPVKSNSGYRNEGRTIATPKNFFPTPPSPKKEIENRSFVVRTNINVNAQ